MIIEKQESKELICEECKATSSEDDSIKKRKKINNIILCDECVMSSYHFCDVCNEAFDDIKSWDLYANTKEEHDRTKRDGYTHCPQKYIVCLECYHKFRSDKNKVIVESVFYNGREGEIDVILTEEIVSKINEKLNQTANYLISLIALRGVLLLSVKMFKTQKEREKDQKYRLARKSLDSLCFSPIDEVAIEQLYQIMDQIHNK